MVRINTFNPHFQRFDYMDIGFTVWRQRYICEPKSAGNRCLLASGDVMRWMITVIVTLAPKRHPVLASEIQQRSLVIENRSPESFVPAWQPMVRISPQPQKNTMSRRAVRYPVDISADHPGWRYHAKLATEIRRQISDFPQIA